MKLITLNTWGGRIQEPLFSFIRQHQDVDVFCFQELYNNATNKMSDDLRVANLNLFSELQKLLPNHVAYFRPHIETVYGIGTFVKKDLTVFEEGDIIIHHNPAYSGSGGDHSRNMQWVTCAIGGKKYSIFNVHGLWNGRGKTDTDERIAQSKRIREYMDSVSGSKILCGDFNLRPDTQSLALIARGMDDLVKKFGVASTRTPLYGKAEQFADYIFVTPDITVKKFEVLPDVVSDHAPLLLEI